MVLRDLLHQLVLEIRELESRIKAAEKHLAALAVQTSLVERLRTVPGVGLLTATALVGFVGDVARFPSGRHFACYLESPDAAHPRRSCRVEWRSTQNFIFVLPDRSQRGIHPTRSQAIILRHGSSREKK